MSRRTDRTDVELLKDIAAACGKIDRHLSGVQRPTLFQIPRAGSESLPADESP